MAAKRMQPMVFPAKGSHTATIIFSHGLGDTAHGWAPAVEDWRRKGKLDEIKFIVPTAPMIPITLNGGYKMPGWFDIRVLGSIDSMRANEDRQGILTSSAYLESLIQGEIASGIPSERIILGGFSQGGAMAIFAGLTSKVKLAGVVAMSSWLVLSNSFRQEMPPPGAGAGAAGAGAGTLGFNADTPVLMCHGDEDPLVRPEMVTLSYSVLNALGYNVRRKEYAGLAHSASLQELNDVEDFFRERLPPLGGKSATTAAGTAASTSDSKSEL